MRYGGRWRSTRSAQARLVSADRSSLVAWACVLLSVGASRAEAERSSQEVEQQVMQGSKMGTVAAAWAKLRQPKLLGRYHSEADPDNRTLQQSLHVRFGSRLVEVASTNQVRSSCRGSCRS